MVTRIPIRYLILTGWLICLFNESVAQAPNISYTPAANVYQTTTAITALTPANSGGAVPATTYGTVSTLASAASNINNPRGLTTDGAGNIYEADFSGNLIYKITAAGVVSVFAGTGAAAELDANGVAAKFNGPTGIVYDGAGHLYVADNGGNTIRKINTAAPYAVTTIAGSGVAAELDGAGILAKFNKPYGIDYDGVAYLYVTDNAGNTIRRITTAGPFTVVTIAGSGAAAESNGNGIAAKFNGPAGIVYDGIANLYVTDATGNTIREINTAGLCPVTTFAGSGVAGSSNATGIAATFKTPYGITMDATGNLIIADEGNSLIRTITVPGAVVTTLAGNGTNADLDGVTTAAEFFSPYAVTADNSGNVFTGDDNAANSTVRKIILTGYVVSPAVPAGLTFNVTTGTISGTPTTTQNATNYTITAYNSWGSSSTIVSIAIGQRNNWTGSVSSAWNNAGNWSLGFVPGQYDNAYIQGGAGYAGPDPTVNASATVYTIQFGTSNTPPNTTLTLNAGCTLTVTGNFLCHTGSTVTVAGTGTVSMSPGSEVDIINSTFPVTSTLLKITTGTFILQSDATGTAFVPALPSGGSITGNVTVQRFITGGGALKYRDYRFFSSPVYSSNQVLGGTTGNVYNLMYLKTGTATNPITTGTNGVANGFDKTGNPTIYVYREDRNATNLVYTGGNYIGVANITAAKLGYDTGGNTTSTGYLPVGNGFAFFFRGSYTNAANLAGRTTLPVVATYYPNSVTVSQVGTLNQGTVPVNLWFNNVTPNSYQSTLSYTAANATVTRGFNLVGNPYASSIDWSTFSNSVPLAAIYGLHVDPTAYEYDPAQVNVYGTYNQQTGVALNNGNNIIVCGQGFFVHANATGGTLQFTESAKTSTQLTSGSTLLLGTPVSNSAYNQNFRLNISKDSSSKFEILVGFNSSSNNNYNHIEDDLYFPAQNPSQSLCIATGDNVNVVSKWMAFPKRNKADTVNITVMASASGTYTLTRGELKAIPQLYEIWLMDAYKKDSLDIRHNSTYVFDVLKTDTSSFGAGRFKLIIRENPALAMRLLNFAVTKATTGAQIVWKTENEQNYTNFTIERSTDGGKTFDILGGFLSSASGTYSFLDKNPLQPGSDLYRLKLEDLNGAISYSEVLSLQYSTPGNNIAGSAVSVYPNPTTGLVNISISQNNGFSPNLSALQAVNLSPRLVNNPSAGQYSYDIKIISITGAVIKTVKSSQPSWQGNLSSLLPGTYIIQVMHANDQSLVGKSTFVKL